MHLVFDIAPEHRDQFSAKMLCQRNGRFSIGNLRTVPPLGNSSYCALFQRTSWQPGTNAIHSSRAALPPRYVVATSLVFSRVHMPVYHGTTRNCADWAYGVMRFMKGDVTESGERDTGVALATLGMLGFVFSAFLISRTGS